MKPCDGNIKESIELSVNDDDKLDDIIESNSQEFIDFIHKIGLDVEHKEITKNAQNSSITILTLKTTCFKVDINQNFAKISPLN